MSTPYSLDVHIKIASIDDLNVLANMFDAYRQFYEQAPDLAAAALFIGDRIKNSESTIFLAQDTSGRSIGFCQLYPSFCSLEAKPIYTLYDLFVDPQFRRSGAARALLLAAVEHAKSKGYARLDLTTARSNLAAQALYEKLGWIRDHVFYAYSFKTGA